jgi:hypothetical protein
MDSVKVRGCAYLRVLGTSQPRISRYKGVETLPFPWASSYRETSLASTRMALIIMMVERKA